MRNQEGMWLFYFSTLCHIIKLMIETIIRRNIFFQWFSWQFFEMPMSILKAWKNFLLFYLNYFSIPLLLKTFFSPWRRYRWYYPRGFDAWAYLEVWVSNRISQVIGLILRTVLIFIGIAVEIFIFFGGLIIFIIWIILPFLLIAGFIFGLTVLF